MPAKKRKEWVGQVFLGREADGKQRYHWVGRFATKRERDDAVAWAKVERPWEAEPKPREMTCDEWADRWIDRMKSGALRTKQGRRCESSTIDTHRSGCRPAVASSVIGPQARSPVSRPRTGPRRSREARCPSAAQLMNYIVSTDDGPDRNRFLGLSHHPAGRKDLRPPSEEEMVLLHEACSALGDHTPRMRALFTFATYTLMRLSEPMALDWEKIDLDAGTHDRVLIDSRFYRGETDLPKSQGANDYASSTSTPGTE